MIVLRNFMQSKGRFPLQPYRNIFCCVHTSAQETKKCAIYTRRYDTIEVENGFKARCVRSDCKREYACNIYINCASMYDVDMQHVLEPQIGCDMTNLIHT
jgi:hypothetical protein